MYAHLGWMAFFVWQWLRTGEEWFFACAMAAAGLALIAWVLRVGEFGKTMRGT